jgi:arylsulfatase
MSLRSTLEKLAYGAVAALALGPAFGLSFASAAVAAEPVRRPNFLVIVADDLGFSDLGAFGGEIATPNLDALAARGVRLTGFHTAPTCSPTRSMLMTGSDNHRVGLGTMAETLTPLQRGRPGYEGYLNDRSLTIAEALKGAGYRTVLSGKWHLGLEEGQSPAARGFDRSFSLSQGLSNHFGADQNAAWAAAGSAPTYREDGKVVRYPDGAYSSDYFAERLIGFLEEGQADPRPFFAYLAFTAPHWPLQAPPETIAKYKGRYDAGPEALRQARLTRQKALGLIPDAVRDHATDEVPEWASLTPDQRAWEARKMEVYAAMVDRLDQNVGRVIAALKAQGRYEDTVIIFLADNGPEATPLVAPNNLTADPAAVATLRIDNGLENLGKASSYVGYGRGWALAASAPSRLVKSYTTEGGIRAPAIVAGPGVTGAGRIADAFLHVKDIQPTLLDLAGATRPTTRAGKLVAPAEGHSWAGLLKGAQTAARPADETVAWELFYRRAVRQGDWKAVFLPVAPGGAYTREAPVSGTWELFNLKDDPGETVDLADREPARLKALVASWDGYAADAGVIIPATLASERQAPGGSQVAGR